MISALQNLQREQGATFAPVSETEAPASFGNDAAALVAARQGMSLCDRTHWGRIRVSDADRLRFLHNQTTNDFQSRQPGQGCDTVFVNSTGRSLDLATAYVFEDAVLLLVSPNRRTALMQWMDRFIFFADKVKLEDVTETTAAFSVLGPQSDALIQQLGAGDLVGQSYGTHQTLQWAGTAIEVAVGSGLAIAGYTLVLPAEAAAPLWQTLVEAGAVPLGEQGWERLRVEQGRPAPDRELTEEFNPLEAGLWHTISLSKGCYIGQETIARLHTYRGVKQQLWGVRLPVALPPETPLTAAGERAGVLTSCIATDDGYLGLAYVRSKLIEAGIQTVQAEGVEGELVAVPFVSHEYL